MTHRTFSWFWYAKIEELKSHPQIFLFFRKIIKNIHIPFVVSILFCFSFFVFYHNITQIVFVGHKTDIFTKNLPEIAFYLWPLDPELSRFLMVLDTVAKSYWSGENIFKKHKDDIDFLVQYIRSNKQRLLNAWFWRYDYLLTFLSDILVYKDTIYELLWSEKSQYYLVLLQNMSEKRPNGWFFWSFALVEIKYWFIQKIEVIDSYLPNFINPQAYVMAPQWSSAFLSDLKIGFISANKLWFTQLDGKNIKDLYEKIYPHHIKWVFFVTSDLFQEIIPWFEEKIWEWQFVNANIDIIRWKNLPNKKELYLKEINEYIDRYKIDIFKNFINRFEDLLAMGQVNIFLSNVPTWIQRYLQDYNLKTTYQSWYMYFWESNSSFNKIDRFVKKVVQFHDGKGNVYFETASDKVKIPDYLLKKEFYVRVYYSLNVPIQYVSFINDLQKKYNISMTEREQFILWLVPFWSTRSFIYYPSSLRVASMWWDAFHQVDYQAPFARGIFFQLTIPENNITRSMNVRFLPR